MVKKSNSYKNYIHYIKRGGGLMSSTLLYVKYIFFSHVNFITSHLGGLESHAHLYLYYCRTAVAEE